MAGQVGSGEGHRVADSGRGLLEPARNTFFPLPGRGTLEPPLRPRARRARALRGTVRV